MIPRPRNIAGSDMRTMYMFIEDIMTPSVVFVSTIHLYSMAPARSVPLIILIPISLSS